MIRVGRLVTIYVGEIPHALRLSTAVYFNPVFVNPMELVP
jgi:hypothetical protein